MPDMYCKSVSAFNGGFIEYESFSPLKYIDTGICPSNVPMCGGGGGMQISIPIITKKEIEPMPMNAIPQIKRLHFNGPATVIIWNDDTKTVVKAMDDTNPNPYFGFCAAVTQKVFGSNCAVKRTIKQLSGVDVNRDPEPAPAPEAEPEKDIDSMFIEALNEIARMVNAGAIPE